MDKVAHSFARQVYDFFARVRSPTHNIHVLPTGLAWACSTVGWDHPVTIVSVCKAIGRKQLIYITISLSLSLHLSLSVCLCLFLSPSLPLSLCFCFSVSLSMYFSHSLSLPLCLFVSVSLLFLMRMCFPTLGGETLIMEDAWCLRRLRRQQPPLDSRWSKLSWTLKLGGSSQMLAKQNSVATLPTWDTPASVDLSPRMPSWD